MKSVAVELPLKSRLVERVRHALRAEILQGRRTGRLPSERRLAEEFEVSRPTLHMALVALQHEGLVGALSRRSWRVTKRIHPAHAAAPRRNDIMILRSTREKPDLAEFVRVTDPLRQKLHRLGYDLKIMDPFGRGLKDVDRLLAAFDTANRPAFYILLSVPPQVHRWFVQRGIPALVNGTREPDVRLPAIDLDNEVMMRHATHYLLRRGHRNIVFFNVPFIYGGSAVQQNVFRQTCDAWPTGDAIAQVITSFVRPTEVTNAVLRVFAHARRPTAVIAMDTEYVFSLYSTLATLGLRIPQDVSVLVLWHTTSLDFLNPLPTCYQVSWNLWANRIARVIRNYFRLGVLPTRFAKVMPTLREGKSVARLQ